MALTGGPWYWMTLGKELKTETKVGGQKDYVLILELVPFQREPTGKPLF